MPVQTIIIALLAMVTLGGLAYVFIDPLVSGERQGEKRQTKIATAAM